VFSEAVSGVECRVRLVIATARDWCSENDRMRPLSLTFGYNEIVGAISFVSTSRRTVWTEDLVRQLKAFAELFSNALRRKPVAEGLLVSPAVLHESEERFKLLLQ
jgi:GAF domain-containing protein